MKSRFLTAAATLLICVVSWAQEPSVYQKSWSLEVGTGIAPLYMTMVPGRSTESALAQNGQMITNKRGNAPMVTLSGVLRISRRSEFTATAQLNWRHYQLKEYPVFGTDPYGNPRYDLNQQGTPAGGATAFAPALTLRYRFLYTPDKAVTLYSGVGLGVVMNVSERAAAVFPDLTLLGLRAGGKHLYFFVELTAGNVATLAYGGLGWKF